MQPIFHSLHEASFSHDALWKMTKEGLPFMKVDVDWAKNKFGVEFTEERATPATGSNTDGATEADKLRAESFFV